MLILDTREAVTAALADTTLDATLRAIVGLRVYQIHEDRQQPLGDVLRIVVVQPRDEAPLVHEALGFPLFHEQADQPGWEWMNDHGSWFELAYVFSDDGYGLLVFVADHPETNETLRFNLLGVAGRPPASTEA